ncbi:MAG: DUF2911 domain-containing protein [Bacteroidota bacterium]
MRQMSLRFSLFVAILAFATSLQAQIPALAPSPGAQVTQRVGLTDIMLNYSRPSVKGRTIFAENGLQPYGDYWRVGANRPTSLKFSDDVTIGGQKVEAGEYTILMIPGKNDWEVKMYPMEGGSWGSYVEKTPSQKWMLKPTKLNDMVETFRIDVNDITYTTANIDFSWEKIKITLPVTVDIDKRMMSSIERVMGGPSANDYVAAASYLFESGNDKKKGLEYMKKANEMAPRYWNLRTEALMMAEMGMKKEAIDVAKKSLSMAKEAGNDQYVRMNEASIKEWMR